MKRAKGKLHRGPRRPAEAGVDWIWVPARECSSQTLIPALLRKQGRMNSRGLAEAMWKLDSDAGMGGIWFAAVTLRKRGVLNCDIRRRWYLKEAAIGGVIWHGHVWGPRESFTAMERALHRRRAVVEILRGGAKVWEEIADGLAGGGWKVEGPAVVRADLRWLVRRRWVKRVATGWRWGLV